MHCALQCEAMECHTYLVSQVVHREIELVANQTTGLSGSHHELVELALTECTLLTVVLHVASVELHELHSLLADEGVLVHKLLHEGVSQEVALLLDDLHLAALRQA